jgi:hypothetical protein
MENIRGPPANRARFQFEIISTVSFGGMAERDIQKQDDPTEAPRKKDLWDILQALGPALIAAAVAVIGSVYSYQQAQMTKASEMREVYTKIMTERENSDNNIRASMFQMLFNAMFDKDINSADTPDNVNQIKKRVMFLDVLSRNFDTVDIKPLFEDLDGELTRKMYNDRSYSDGAQEDYLPCGPNCGASVEILPSNSSMLWHPYPARWSKPSF